MTTDTVGGIWTYAVELAGALQEFDVDVVLATMGAPMSDEQAHAVAQLENVTVYESSYKLEWMEEPWEDVRAAGEWLLEIKNAESPDLVHLNSYAHASLPWRLPVLVVGHSCVYSWFEAVKDKQPPSHWEHYRRKVHRGLQSADLVTAPTEAMLEALSQHYGSFHTADVIYNGRQPGDFAPAASEPFVLSAGRLWDEAKNISVLEEVAPSLDWPIRAIGSKQSPDGREVQFDALQAPGKQPSSELAAQMGRASIYVLPAYYEPFGLTILEAALAKCALVVGDIPSLREVWAEAAIYVPPDDPPAIRAQLEQLIVDDDLRRQKAEMARERARNYSSRQMASDYVRTYQRLLEEEISGERKMTMP